MKRPPAIGLYAMRRLSRLCLPYFIILVSTFVFVVSTGFSPPGTNHFYNAPTSLTVSLFASLVFLHDTIFGTFPRLFPPGWFLETQAQFYAIAPAIAVLYLRVQSTKLRLFTGCVLLFLFSLLALLTKDYGPIGAQYSILAFMPYFWCGALLADLYHNHGFNMVGRTFWGWEPLGWCTVSVFIAIGTPFGYDVSQLIGRLVCLVIIFKVAFVNDNSFHRVLANRFMAWIGLACYSIFLVHLQVMQILTPAISELFTRGPFIIGVLMCCVILIPVVLLTSYLFFRFVERPGQRVTEWLLSRWTATELAESAFHAGSKKGLTINDVRG